MQRNRMNKQRLFAMAVGMLSAMVGSLGELRAQMYTEGIFASTGAAAARKAAVVRPQRIKFYFVTGSSDLVFQYGPNLMQRQQFDSLARRVAEQETVAIDSIVLTAYTSTLDSRIGTRELAEARILAVKDFLVGRLEHNELHGVRFLTHVREAEEDYYDSDGEFGDGNDGADAWLGGDDIYNKVRRVEVATYLGGGKGAKGVAAANRMQSQINVTRELTDAISDTMSAAQRERQLAAIRTNPYPVWRPGVMGRNVRAKYEGPIDQILSLRTNLPYWLVAAPNAGLEFHIGGHFSILLEGTLTFWEKQDNTGNKGIYVAGAGPEFRYWFGDDRSRAGHIIGLYGQYADYDIKLNQKGRQGTVMGGGISYGYYLPVGRRWAFEFGIGIGYLANKMDVYEWNSIVKRNLWVEQKNKPWIGPTKVRATVIFRMGHKERVY